MATPPPVASIFEIARLKYRPARVKYLVVAEAPPAEDRFFYFDNVTAHDHLFVETMKTLYAEDFPGTRAARPQKGKFLSRFQADGFYLIDAVPTPLADTRPRVKRLTIATCLPELRKRIDELADVDTWVLLVSTPVYDVCASPLRAAGVRIGNDEPIPFPSTGWQKEFREKLLSTLLECRWLPES